MNVSAYHASISGFNVTENNYCHARHAGAIELDERCVNAQHVSALWVLR